MDALNANTVPIISSTQISSTKELDNWNPMLDDGGWPLPFSRILFNGVSRENGIMGPH